MFGFLAFVLTLAGAASLYLGSRHQQWREAPLSHKVSIPVSALLLLLALGGWIHATQPLTGTFIFLTLLMLLWSILPFIAVYTRGRQ
ncbi:hypothetical protein CR159_10050 [Pollutimonas subterranea]|uniref:Uncharacterized protein n=1 Tax=Pollutimonas subterranea TaxID=2045210 RepID=A0A2N4U4M6_9BURK|nr:hypothetical protein [Pollutimonas subterranea]PLC49974.1 hypothetical protein CR159_10050 [Pollutimonas subterranea]